MSRERGVTPSGTQADQLTLEGRAAPANDLVGARSVTRADQLIQELPFRWSVQGRIFLIGGLAYMFDAWNVLLPAYLFPLLGRSTWHLNTSQLGWLGSSGLVGMALGAFIWGTLADIIGRKRAFLWTLLNYSFFSILSALAPTFSTLLVARFITGVGLGGCIPVAYTLVAEFMPRSRRGMMLTAMDVWWPIGGTLNGLLAIVMLRYDSWRLLLLAMGVPALLVFWALSSMPESPPVPDAARSHGLRHERWSSIWFGGQAPWSATGVYRMPTPQFSTFRQFFTMFERIWSWNWRVTLMTWGLMIASLLLYFGVLTWLPQILVSSGYGIYRAYLFTLSVTAIGIVATLLSAWLVEEVGRKWVIIVPGIHQQV